TRCLSDWSSDVCSSDLWHSESAEASAAAILHRRLETGGEDEDRHFVSADEGFPFSSAGFLSSQNLAGGRIPRLKLHETGRCHLLAGAPADWRPDRTDAKGFHR